MKFSILISSFNKGRYIEDCIKSCLNQNYSNFEVILFDNLSTDQSNKIFKKYQNKIQIIKKKKVSNYSALNQTDLIRDAFELSKGSIICLLDADDFFVSSKLDRLRKIFNSRSDINSIFDLPILRYRNNDSKFILKEKIQKYIWPSIIPTSGISCKRDFFQFFINNSFPENYNLLEIDFRLNVLSRNIDKKFKICEEDLTFYRQVDDGVMSSIKKFSPKWWTKRYQAHRFMSELYSEHNKNYDNNLDYYLSKFIFSITQKIK